MMKTLIPILSAAALLAACGQEAAPPATDSDAASPPVETAPAGTPDGPLIEALADVAAANYSLEKTHAFLVFKVGHMGGLSSYRVNFTDFDADLDFNPEAPEQSSLTVTVNPLGLQTNYPGDYKAGHADSGFETWEEDIARNSRWLNADAHPQITFTSTSIERTGDMTGRVTGDLAFLGATRPVTLDVTFNGSGNAPWFGERDLIGFDATTMINRSEFGMDAALPSISDAVEIEFSGEFLQDE